MQGLGKGKGNGKGKGKGKRKGKGQKGQIQKGFFCSEKMVFWQNQAPGVPGMGQGPGPSLAQARA